MPLLEITKDATMYADRDAVEVELARTIGMSSLVHLRDEVTVEVEAREVVKALDGEADTNEVEARALARLAADALDLADRWDRGTATLAEVRARAEALRDGYARLAGDL